MNITAVENLGNLETAKQKAPQADALRRAAEQFEAVLLMQLTSALNNVGGDEDSLFGQDGGSDLAQKMFSEQLATAMAEAGGIGLKDVILKQFGLDQNSLKAGNNKNPNSLSKAITAFQDIKQNDYSPTSINKNIDVSKLINRSGKTNPVTDDFGTLKPGEAEIISTTSQNEDEDWRRAFTGEKKTERLNVPQSVINEILSPNKKSDSVSSPSPNTFEMPVEGRISSKFGNRFHPIDKRMKFHTGLDIAANRGTPINSAADGVVIFAGRNGGYGNMVIVDHGNGITSRYAHANELLVENGQKVKNGQQIATVGSTGKSTNPHLHFEVRENGKPINPLNFISKVLP